MGRFVDRPTEAASRPSEEGPDFCFVWIRPQLRRKAALHTSYLSIIRHNRMIEKKKHAAAHSRPILAIDAAFRTHYT